MSLKSAGMAAAIVALMLGSGAPFEGGAVEAAGQQEMTENPFFTESTLPYQLPPFDRIEDAHYGPAFDRGMAEQIEEIEAIASQSDPPTFENTIVPLERSGRCSIASRGRSSASPAPTRTTPSTRSATRWRRGWPRIRTGFC